MGNKATTLVKLTIASSCMLGGIVFRPLLLAGSIPWVELLNALVGIAGNNTASAIDTLIEGQGSDRIALPSDDLTKTVGRAIAAVIALAAKQHPGKVGSYLEKIAAQAAQNWLQLARQDLTQQRYPVLKAGQVEAFLTQEEEDYAKKGNLTPSDWENIFRRLNMAACQEGGFPLPPEVYPEVAGLLHAHFPQALKAALKDDFATDGKAFAGVTLQLLLGLKAELARQKLSQTADQMTGWPESLVVLQRLEAQLQGSAAEQQAAFRQMAEHIDSSFAAVCAQMGVMENTITDLLQPLAGNLERLRQDVAEVRQDIRQGFEEVKQRDDRQPSWQEFRSRQKLLKDLRTEVESRLSQSLHNAVLLNLGKEVQPHQVQRPYDVSIKLGQQQSFQLPSETSILDVFDHETIGGRFLILGKPGSGKSTTLLELAKALLERAEADSNAPIPVLLELSTWQKVTNREFLPFSKPVEKEHDPLINQWIVTQLERKGIISKISDQWLLNKELILLLDGLDELSPDRQSLCVLAINRFIESKFCPLNMVVCSRKEEYEQHQEVLLLNGSINLQELSGSEIEKYLVRANLKDFWEGIKDSEQITSFLSKPLFLHIACLVCQSNDFNIKEWQDFDNPDGMVKKLLGFFYSSQKSNASSKKRMWYFRRSSSLIFLAQYIDKLDDPDFSLYELQTSILKKGKSIYWTVDCCLRSSIVIAEIYIIFMLLKHAFKSGILLLMEGSLTWREGSSGMQALTIAIFLVGLVVYLQSALLHPNKISLERVKGRGKVRYSFPTATFLKESFKNVALNSFGAFTISSFLCFGFLAAFIPGYFLAVLNFYFEGESISRYLRFLGLMIITLGSLVIMISIIVFIGSLISAFWQSLVQQENYLEQSVSKYKFGYPNLIFNTFFDLTLIACFCISFLLLVFFVFLNLGLVSLPGIPWRPILIIALALGAIGSGMFDLLNHFVLRFLVAFYGYLPWDITRFLDECTEHLVLQRVGNRYRFIHRLVQEHFANLEILDNPSKPSR